MSKDAVSRVLELCIGRLADETWIEADTLNGCDERVAALTLICQELVDADVSITAEIYEGIRGAARELDLGTDPFPTLEALVRD